MRTSDLDYILPKELIAQESVSPRDAARLMVLNRKDEKIKHFIFKDLPNFLKKGDVLVFNKSKVFPARVYGKTESGKRVEIVFLEEIEEKLWEAIISGNVNDGENIIFPDGLLAKIKKKDINLLSINKSRGELFNYLEKYGHVPLPPYINREDNEDDKNDYQTVFAKETGSAAAPTAGLHFTEELISKLKSKGVQIEYVTLHVGLGTFAPVRAEKVEDHDIHSEFFEVDKETSERLNKAKKERRRIIACGTTSVRVLETCAEKGQIKPKKEHTKLFIYPGYEFKFIDSMVTNFHTPKSSLLALVYAFYGEEKTKKAYQEAINEKYRFFSYGDGMLIM